MISKKSIALCCVIFLQSYLNAGQIVPEYDENQAPQNLSEHESFPSKQYLATIKESAYCAKEDDNTEIIELIQQTNRLVQQVESTDQTL